MNDARFTGEEAQPPVLFECDYCGRGIRDGCGYYRYDTLRICDKCARRFAWAQFLLEASRQTALPDHWI